MNKQRRTAEQQRMVMEVRRSSAASPHRNKSKYNRKVKHKGLSLREQISTAM